MTIHSLPWVHIFAHAHDLHLSLKINQSTDYRLKQEHGLQLSDQLSTISINVDVLTDLVIARIRSRRDHVRGTRAAWRPKPIHAASHTLFDIDWQQLGSFVWNLRALLYDLEMPLVVISYHWLSWVAIGFHRLPLVVICCHGLSWVAMGCHWLSWVAIGCHGLSWVAIGCHGLP
jgi:hypothetical protein